MDCGPFDLDEVWRPWPHHRTDPSPPPCVATSSESVSVPAPRKHYNAVEMKRGDRRRGSHGVSSVSGTTSLFATRFVSSPVYVSNDTPTSFISVHAVAISDTSVCSCWLCSPSMYRKVTRARLCHVRDLWVLLYLWQRAPWPSRCAPPCLDRALVHIVLVFPAFPPSHDTSSIFPVCPGPAYPPYST